MARPIKRRRGVPSGFLILILGAWGALVPFIGPYFDYSIGSADTWHWATNRLWLSIVPGAVAAIGGLMMIFGRTRRTVSTGALIATLAGIWFVIGPSMSMIWENGSLGTGAALGDSGTRVLEWIGYFYGLGALITALGAYEVGFMAAVPVVDEPVAARPATEADERRRFSGRRRWRRGSRRDEAPAAGDEAPVAGTGRREDPAPAERADS